MSKISKVKHSDMLRKMYLTRNFEEKVAYFFAMGMVHGTTHLCVGQEGCATGVMGGLKPQDLAALTHRGHGQCISKGIDLNRMMSEFLGKEDGYCKGKGGSMHIADINNGNLGANGVVGGGIALATGAALSVQMRKLEDTIVVGFFGDGASNEGAFHEALNLAAIWNLPIIFLCEDNKFGMSMSRENAMRIDDIAIRAKSYGIKGKRIDGNNVVEVLEETKKARAYVLKNGPMLLVCDTYRVMGHSKSDANAYRSKEVTEEWKKKGPIIRYNKYLIENGILTQAEIDDIAKISKEDIEAAVEHAEAQPYPSIDTIEDDIFA